MMAWRVLRLPPIPRLASNILIKQSQTAEKGKSSILGLGKVLILTKRKHVPHGWNDPLVQPKQ